MARTPFYGRTPAPQIARMDMQSATAPGRFLQQSLTQLGQSISGALIKHAENKEKKENEKLAENLFLSMKYSPEESKVLSKLPEVGQLASNLKTQQLQQESMQSKMDELQEKEEGISAFADALLAGETDAMPALGTITDPEKYQKAAQKYAFQNNNPFFKQLLGQGLQKRREAQQELKKEGLGKVLDQGNKLRTDFENLPENKDFKKVRASYDKVKSAGMNPSAAGDISLVFNYMKILDPGSVVREGEFATAENAGGVPTKIANFYNKLASGERLTDKQRQDFMNQARLATLNQFAPVQEQVDRYTTLATRRGVDPVDVIPSAYLDLGEVLKEEIATPADPSDDASDRALQATPSAKPASPISTDGQSTMKLIMDKAKNGQPLSEKEQRVLQLIEQRNAQQADR